MKSGMLKGSLGVVMSLALVCALTSVPMVAQVVTGTLSGTVTDQTGAVVGGATVTLISQGSNAKQHATTSDTGAFRFSLLAVGPYDVEVTKPGFKKAKLTGAVVESNVEHGLGLIRLEIGQASESVEVTAAPPLVESTQAQISTTISGEALQTFAGVAEGEGLDFVALTLPGVGNSRDNNFSNTNGIGFSVDGIRGRNNDQQIDGQNNNDNSVAGPQIFVFDSDFVNEYQATTGQFGPEYGRNSGSVINIVTKNGTNRWHGTVFGQETNSILTSLTNEEKNFSTPPITKPPRFNEEFSGGSIGGPLWKDRVFIFGGFDNQVNSSGALFATGHQTPTSVGIGQLASCFPDSTSVPALSAFGPFSVGAGSPTISGTPTTVDYNPATDTNPNGIPLVVPNPNDGNGGCNVQLAGVQRILSNGSHTYNFITRLDVHVSDKDSFNLRYLYQKQLYYNDYESPGSDIAAGYPFNVPSLGQSGLIDWTHTFSNRMLNELRIGYQRTSVEFGTNTAGTVPAQGAIGSALTNVSFSNTGLLGFGPDTNMPQGRIVNTYQLQDNFEFTMGRHQLKWGANITNQRSPNVFLPNYNGAYSFQDWGYFGANLPTSVSVTAGNPEYGFKEWDTFLYVGDDWKVKSNLTLNLGLTWSYLGQPANLFHQETVKQQTGPNPFWDTALPLSDTTSPSVGTVYSLFGPSIGFAWSPNGPLTGNGKTVLRGGFRMTYDPSYYNTFLINAISAPVVLAQTLFPTAATDTTPQVNIPGLPAAPFGSAIRSLYASSLTTGVFDPRFFNRTVTPPTFRPDRYYQWSFGIQREIVKDAAVEVRYVGNHGNDEFQEVNANPYIAGLAQSYPNLVPAGVTPCPASGILPTDLNQTALGRVSCNAGITNETANTAYSNYNGLQAELRVTNIFKQLTLRTSYTFSKTLDNASEIFSTFAGANSVAYSQNVLNYQGQEYGLSGINFPQTWTLAFVEDIPFMRSQPGIIGHVLGGWAISGTYLLQSGQGFTPSQIYANASTGGVANDTPFDLAEVGIYETSRPFVGGLSAPEGQVGVYFQDACGLGLVAPTSTNTAPCSATTPLFPANQLVSLNTLNTSGVASPVTNGQVRTILNGGEADAVFGTPFGNVGRNSLKDFHTNVANLTLFKNVKAWERATVQWHMTANNVFNHSNYQSVWPFAEYAGVPGYYTTFADPQVTFNGQNSCPAGVRCIFFGLKVIY